MGFFNELIQPIYEMISTPFYKIYFWSRLSTYRGFKHFIRYKKVLYGKIDTKMCENKTNNKKFDDKNMCQLSKKRDKYSPVCTYPCPHSYIDFNYLYQELSQQELRLIYKDIKKNFKYDTKPLKFGSFGNRPRYTRLSGRSYYEINKHCIFDIVVSFAQDKIKLKIKKENETKRLERQKQDEIYKQQCIQNAKTNVRILNVFKSHNPYQNNAKSIGITYKILDTDETFTDYITACDSDLLQYKTSRLQIVTDTTSIEDIFDKNFILWKNLVIGQEIVVDTKIENEKRQIDYFIGSIFYKK